MWRTVVLLSLILAVVAQSSEDIAPWTAAHLQEKVNDAISNGSKQTIEIPPGDYYFYHHNFNISHAHNLRIRPTFGNVTLWFSGDAGINMTHSTNVELAGPIVIDYDPPPPPSPTFQEKSGITIHLYNCTRVTCTDVTIRAAPFMAVTAFQGGGDHLFQRLRFVPNTHNRALVGVRDALHFSDLRKGPTVIDSTIGYTGDDFFNVHTTLLLVLECTGQSQQAQIMECLLVNPRVTTDALRETVYGTFSTLKFVQPDQDALTFYPWPASDMIFQPPLLRGAIVQALTDVSQEFGARAQRLLPPLLMHPPTMSWIEATNQTTKFVADEVWKVVLNTKNDEWTAAPPALGSLVTIDTMASAEAKFINNTFVHSHCNIGRFKSSRGIIQGNVFSQARIPNLEISALPQWFEGPIEIQDILVADNVFEEMGTRHILHCGPLCEKPECHPCAACPSCDKGTTSWARNVTLRNNTVVAASAQS